MNFSYNEFEVITIIERENTKLSQREISKLSGLSLGTVNKIVSTLLDNNLINDDNLITKVLQKNNVVDYVLNNGTDIAIINWIKQHI